MFRVLPIQPKELRLNANLRLCYSEVGFQVSHLLCYCSVVMSYHNIQQIKEKLRVVLALSKQIASNQCLALVSVLLYRSSI